MAKDGADVTQYYRLKQAARLLPVDYFTVRRWCQEGLFPGAIKIGRTWLIPKSAIDPPAQPKGD